MHTVHKSPEARNQEGAQQTLRSPRAGGVVSTGRRARASAHLRANWGVKQCGRVLNRAAVLLHTPLHNSSLSCRQSRNLTANTRQGIAAEKSTMRPPAPAQHHNSSSKHPTHLSNTSTLNTISSATWQLCQILDTSGSTRPAECSMHTPRST